MGYGPLATACVHSCHSYFPVWLLACNNSPNSPFWLVQSSRSGVRPWPGMSLPQPGLPGGVTHHPSENLLQTGGRAGAPESSGSTLTAALFPLFFCHSQDPPGLLGPRKKAQTCSSSVCLQQGTQLSGGAQLCVLKGTRQKIQRTQTLSRAPNLSPCRGRAFLWRFVDSKAHEHTYLLGVGEGRSGARTTSLARQRTQRPKGNREADSSESDRS